MTHSTLGLLDKALATGKTQADLCRTLHLSDSALTQARKRGRLSPTVAGQLAALVGDDVQHWMALAAIESEPRSRVTDTLRRLIDGGRGRFRHALRATRAAAQRMMQLAARHGK